MADDHRAFYILIDSAEGVMPQTKYNHYSPFKSGTFRARFKTK